MTDNFAFMSYRSEIPWIAQLARALRARGFGSELWVVDSYERQLGESSGAFDRVVDLRGDFSRRNGRPAATIDGDAVSAAAGLEEELGFGPFLHREASVDRVLTGRNHLELPPIRMAHRWHWDDLCDFSTKVAQTVQSRLRDLKPRVVVAEASLFSARLVARLVIAEGTPFLSPMILPYLDGRMHCTHGLDGQWPRCTDTYRELKGKPLAPDAEQVARRTLATIRRGTTMTVRREAVKDYLGTPRARLDPRRVTNLATDWNAARSTQGLASPHSSHPELLAPVTRLARKARRRLVRDAFDRESGTDLPTGRFAAFFIHAQPEFTVDAWAFEHYDQIAAIRNIASTLPADVVLAVKEHRIQAGWRDASFYKELYSMPGIVVLNDAVSSSEVTKRAEMVFSLTGTVSMEAMCLGVPAVLLGSVYFEHFEGIFRAESYEELKAIVHRRGDFVAADDESCLRALAARYLASRPGGWMSGGRTAADPDVTAQSLIEESAP